MKEYTTLSINYFCNMERDINEYAEHGWEVTTIVPFSSGGFAVIMERYAE